jgi:viroplasmin and RNaseH domain-containing protein
MPISFTNQDDEPPLVETAGDSLSSEEEEDTGEEESQVSASEYEGNLSDIPVRMMFGSEECGAIFSLHSDKGAFFRVCGCRLEGCKRGHQASRLTNRAKPGSYETIRSRKYVDGKLETWIPVEEYEAEARARKAKQAEDLKEAASLLTKARTPESNKSSSPSGSEEEAYSYAVKTANLSTGTEGLSRGMFSPGDWTKESSPVVHDRSPSPMKDNPSLKKAPIMPKEEKQVMVKNGEPRGKVVSSEDEGVTNPGAPHSGSDEAMRAMMKMMSGVNDSLQAMAGGMKDLRQERQESPPAWKSAKGIRCDGPKYTLQDLPMGSSKSPREGLSEIKARHKGHHEDWYAVAKGKDGATGVFDNYEEAKGLVYRVSGAIWKRFKTYDEAWIYVQSHLEEESDSDPEWFYGVANGKDDFNGVLTEYPSAQKLVERISGASWKKFRTHKGAKRFVQRHRQDLRSPSRKQEGSPRRTHFGDSDGERRSPSPEIREYSKVQAPMSVIPDPRKKDLERKTKLHSIGYDEGLLKVEGYRPPLELTGEDPSTGQDDEVWGIDIGAGEIALREKLCPPDLPVGLQKGLVDSMIDAVAQPGGSMGGTEAEATDTEMLGNALHELVYQGRGGAEDGNSRRTDMNWRALKKTSVREITDAEKLRRRIKVLIKLREKMPKRVMKSSKNAFIRAGWTDPLRIEAWAQGGYFLRIARDSLDFYLSLHQHLMGLATTEHVPWSYVQTEIDHHIEELDLIRSSQDSRLQALLGLYAYLRDGVSKNWHSSSLQYKRNLDAMALSGSEPKGRDSLPLTCIKCQTALHSGGKINCPWKNLSDSGARKKGAAVLTNWANGTCAPECPPDA